MNTNSSVLIVLCSMRTWTLITVIKCTYLIVLLTNLLLLFKLQEYNQFNSSGKNHQSDYQWSRHCSDNR